MTMKKLEMKEKDEESFEKNIEEKKSYKDKNESEVNDELDDNNKEDE
jgi:hypothetical protein